MTDLKSKYRTESERSLDWERSSIDNQSSKITNAVTFLSHLGIFWLFSKSVKSTLRCKTTQTRLCSVFSGSQISSFVFQQRWSNNRPVVTNTLHLFCFCCDELKIVLWSDKRNLLLTENSLYQKVCPFSQICVVLVKDECCKKEDTRLAKKLFLFINYESSAKGWKVKTESLVDVSALCFLQYFRLQLTARIWRAET